MCLNNMFRALKGYFENKEIHDNCSSCGNPIYKHMKYNVMLSDDLDMCGACVNGEAAAYYEEL